MIAAGLRDEARVRNSPETFVDRCLMAPNRRELICYVPTMIGIKYAEDTSNLPVLRSDRRYIAQPRHFDPTQYMNSVL